MSLTATDIFCGGGGSSTGIITVPGVDVVMAANHNDLAIRVHNANHPTTDHACVDLHHEDPAYFPKTNILWASPECTKWSQASGGRYASVSTYLDGNLLDLLNPDLVEDDPETTIVQRSRLLMFDVLRFVEYHRYAAMIVENVVDIATNPKFAPEWALWRKGLTNLGYDYRVVSLNSMHAQAKGDPAPQSRDRLYIVCWRRGNKAPDIDSVMRPIAWCPKCEQVIESQQAWKNGRTVGKYRAQYVYIHGSCGTTVEPGWLPAAAAIDWSLPGKRIGDRKKDLAPKTRARIAAGIARYWRPFSLEAAGNTFERRPGVRTWPIDSPLTTLHTTASKALAVPVEGRDGKRAKPVSIPGRTQTARAETALVTAPFIAELRGGGSDARAVREPMSTVTASGNHHALIQANNHANRPHPVTEPLPTSTTATGGGSALLTPYYGSSEQAKPVTDAIGTLTTVDRYALIQRHNSSKGDGGEMLTPATEAMRTLTTTGHQSLITPGDVKAAEAMVDDCLFRMLEPHEVAAGMAFPSDYIWEGNRRERVRLAGNAVTPPAARDLMWAVAESLGGAA